MKIAFYMEDGLEQIVLTPESEFERTMLGKLHSGRELQIKRGSFFECRGGWVRWDQSETDDSTMLVLRPPPPAQAKDDPPPLPREE